MVNFTMLFLINQKSISFAGSVVILSVSEGSNYYPYFRIRPSDNEYMA